MWKRIRSKWKNKKEDLNHAPESSGVYEESSAQQLASDLEGPSPQPTAAAAVTEESTKQDQSPPFLVEPKNIEVREMLYRQLKEARKIAPYMVSREDLVEQKIRESMERGEFNNLKGQGKPLPLEDNPFEDPELRLCFKILKDAGFAPYWIELGKEIDAEIDRSRMMFEQFLSSLIRRKSTRGMIEITPQLMERKANILNSCRSLLESANKKIDTYNRILPIFWMQKKRIDVSQELEIMKKKWDELMPGTMRDKKSN